jgi:drug/metabolite transporter (DMT)-like permease
MDDTAADAAYSAPARAERRQRVAGIVLMCAALLCFSGIDASAKWANQSVDPLMTIWARFAANVVLVSFLINPWTRPGVLRTKRPALQVVRSLLPVLSTAFNFDPLR